jgi:ATP-dependent DNA helicase RecQ
MVVRPMDARDKLREIFGFQGFRPGQAESVDAALRNRDALVVMPTGSGKSVCYQLPALIRDDLTLVVSPLVSLMADQVAALERVAPGRVAVVNAQRGFGANAAALQEVREGTVRLLYIAPERFGSPRFIDALAGVRVGLFVVDEAHCVSQWGHDFRPDYFTLADAAARVGARATLALTATATPRVADDIVRRLRLRDPVRVTTGFDRPNLSFAVVGCRGGLDKERRLAAALAEPGALPAIVYAGTRDATERLARALAGALDARTVVYHAGMDRGARAAAQQRFMSGEAEVIVATNAFGMGIDKADVRTVCHATVPGSLEAYYQEAGRAGRDGRPARCLLFAEQRDKGLHVFFIQRAHVELTAIERVGERLNWAGIDGRYDVALSELAGLASDRRDDEAVRAIIGHLARAGVLVPTPAPYDRAAGTITGGFDRRAAAVCMGSAREAERVRWAQYRAVWEYVEGTRCRREALLAHFGDRSRGAPSVECCDVCAPSLVAAPPAAVAAGAPPAGSGGGDLDSAITRVVSAARPAVGRTRAVEILRGGRSKIVVQNAYDGLPDYGAFAHLRSEDVLGRVDELLAAGTLRSSGGRFPKLRAA